MMDQRQYWDERLRKHFDIAGVGYLSLGRSYNWWLYCAKVRALKRATRAIGLQLAGARVLDVGCGTGFWVKYFKRLGARDIVGLDSSPMSIETLRKRYPEYTFVQTDIASSDLGLPGRFNVISAFEVLWYLSDEEFRHALANIAKLAAPGAHLFITDHLGASNQERPTLFQPGRERPRSLQTYATECAQNGMRALGVFPLYYLMNAPIDSRSIGNAVHRAVVERIWHCLQQFLPRLPCLGHPLGAILFSVDGLALRCLTAGPSTKLLVCRFEGGEI